MRLVPKRTVSSLGNTRPRRYCSTKLMRLPWRGVVSQFEKTCHSRPRGNPVFARGSGSPLARGRRKLRHYRAGIAVADGYTGAAGAQAGGLAGAPSWRSRVALSKQCGNGLLVRRHSDANFGDDAANVARRGDVKRRVGHLNVRRRQYAGHRPAGLHPHGAVRWEYPPLWRWRGQSWRAVRQRKRECCALWPALPGCMCRSYWLRHH